MKNLLIIGAGCLGREVGCWAKQSRGMARNGARGSSRIKRPGEHPGAAQIMNGETSHLLGLLTGQVRTRYPDGQFSTIQRLGVARLCERDTLLGAVGVGGIELAAFIAALGAEHSPTPNRFLKILQACRAAQSVAESQGSSDGQLKAALIFEIAKIFDRAIAAPRRGPDRNRLLILDDIFPVLLSAFRIAEYNVYLERYPDATVHSTGTAYHHARETRPLSAVMQDYEAVYPALAGRVQLFNVRELPAAGLIYTIFINNAYKFLPLAEATGTPLVFTLYPGGGFQLDDPKSDLKPRRVFASPSFRRAIVTQAVTLRYLLEKKFCAPEKIWSVFGGVLPTNQTSLTATPKRRFGVDKATLDICFVANKYMPGGVDEGYDVFLATARRLAAEFPAAHFHVEGTLTEADGDFTGIRERTTMHEILTTEALHRFIVDMDLILSPNLPSKLKLGAFDGFPTGNCEEAGLSGVAVFCTDELKLNTASKPDEEIVMLNKDLDAIFATVSDYCADSIRLHRLADRGPEAFQKVYALSAQMAPRFAVLDQFLN